MPFYFNDGEEFYRRQDEHIRELEKIASTTEAETSDVEVTSNHHSIRRQTRINTMIIGAVFCANVVLLLGKAVASALSGSLAIISSLLDSCVDLASGGIMWFAARQMRKRKPYKYPEGRTRLEPLAVIVLSVFMGSISIQLVAESVQAIVRMSQNNQEAPNVNDLALGIMASVIVTKLILWIIFFKFGGGMAIDALKTDQRNDILTNAASILFSGFAGRLLWDMRMGDRPCEIYSVHEPFRSQLCMLYENDAIFDKFLCGWSDDDR
ncbi:hypothetical protein MS3_00010617 [Schistosoma haematobium]|uniref:Cation efflux protein transmembrane domain-containing protein n=1 Tax=Schistosoma haematobium TaxID=6185 RepID=A0A922LK63_SCHHA|nr:hypothetical protein MS3_00010617 [Schistosoma haematobium]KAH9587744.1 hypothetical protein MS3_00010617 [Schistosoma haematobium]